MTAAVIALSVATIGLFIACVVLTIAVRRQSIATTALEKRVSDVWEVSSSLGDALEVMEEQGRCIDRLQADYKAIVVAVDEGIQDVKRRENRIRASVRRAQDELAAHGLEVPSITAEARELLDLDGEPRAAEELPPVQESMDLPTEIPGVPGTFSPRSWAALGLGDG